MTIAHHPPERFLAAFAAGKLDEGEHLVVAVHASQCPVCRRFVRAVEAIGGNAIEAAEPVAMSKGVIRGRYGEGRTLNAENAGSAACPSRRR